MDRRANVFLGLLMAITAGFAIAMLVQRDETAEARIWRTGTIRIGYAIEAPYAFRDRNGRVTGESPEVARAVLARIGITRTEWLASEFATLIPELRAGRIDMIAAGMFIRPERAAQVSFTRPSACIEPGLLVARGNPLALHSLHDLVRDRRARLAVLRGAAEADEAQQAGVPQPRIRAYASAELALEALRSGLVDALALSGPTVQFLADAHPDLARAEPFSGLRPVAGCAAFAFRKSDTELLARVDAALGEFVGGEAHLALVAPFGFTHRSLPGN